MKDLETETGTFAMSETESARESSKAWHSERVPAAWDQRDLDAASETLETCIVISSMIEIVRCICYSMFTQEGIDLVASLSRKGKRIRNVA